MKYSNVEIILKIIEKRIVLPSSNKITETKKITRIIIINTI